jgi:molybdopterin synthase sulfur carrier subunit
MKVRVRFFGHLQDILGKKTMSEVELEDGATISSLLDELAKNASVMETLLDESRHMRSTITILKNGREIKFLDNLDTRLSAGDEVSIFPFVAGGS